MIKILTLLVLASGLDDADVVERDNIRHEEFCWFRFNDGYHVSLKPLARRHPPDYIYVDSDPADEGRRRYEYTYYFNICHPTIMTCNGEEDAMGVQKIGDECVAILGRGQYTGIEYMDKENRNGFKLTYKGGDKCGPVEREINHYFKCDPKITNDLEAVSEVPGTCSYNVMWRSRYACSNYIVK